MSRPDSMSAMKSSYVPAIDGLRALSILCVLAFHGVGCLKSLVGKSGWLGVDIFFVISGFLITRLAIQELAGTGQVDFKRFYRHRILRIAPAFYFMLAIYALFNPFNSDRNLAAVCLAGLHLSDYDVGLGWGNSVISGLAFCWSLSVEEKYYLLFPLLIWAYNKLRSPLLFVLLFAGCQFWKAFVIAGNPDWVRLTGPFDMRFDTILVGCIAACWFDHRNRQMTDLASRLNGFPGSRFMAPLLFLLGWYWLYHFLSPVDPRSVAARSLFFIGFMPCFSALVALFLVVITANHERGESDLVSRLLRLPPLVWLGRISYSLYLWHGVGFSLAEQWALKNQILSGFTLDGVRLGLAIGLAAGSYYIIERPFLAMKSGPVPSRLPATNDNTVVIRPVAASTNR